MLVAHILEGRRKLFGTAVEHADVRVRMLLPERGINPIPIWAAIMRWSSERGDSILLCANVLDNNVVDVLLLHAAGKIDVDLDPVLGILFLQRMQKRVEPLGGAEIANHPGKIDL